MKKDLRKLLFSVAYILLAGIMVVSLTVVITELVSRKQAKEDFDKLSEITKLPQIQTGTDVGKAPDGNTSEDENNMNVGEVTVIKTRDIELLSSMNADCIGWVSVTDTAVDYPVMHTPGWAEKYLKKNFEKKRSSSGTPFMEERCSLDSENIVIYGHNMTNGTMFAPLLGYLKSDFCKSHPTFEFETDRGMKTYRVFAVAQVKANDEWYYFTETDDSSVYDDWVDYIKYKSIYYLSYTPSFGDGIVTLSTCYGPAKNDRLIIVGAEVANG